MKKISRTIALILVLVMAAGSFTGCLSWYLMTGEPLSLGASSGGDAWALIFLPLVDIVVLPVALVVFAVRTGIEAGRNKRGRELDSIDTFSEFIRSLPEEELASLMQTFDSLPEEELASLTQRFYSLPEAEIDSFAETINSFSEVEFTAMVAAFNNLSGEEIASSMEALNSMPEERLVSTMNNLRHTGFRYQY